MELQALLKLLGFTGLGAGTGAIVILVVDYLKHKSHDRKFKEHEEKFKEHDKKIEKSDDKINDQNVQFAKIEQKTDTLVEGQKRIFDMLNKLAGGAVIFYFIFQL